MKLFQKATDSVGKYFQKGNGNSFLRKFGNTAKDLAPLVGLVNPYAGVASTVIGNVLPKFANSIKN